MKHENLPFPAVLDSLFKDEEVSVPLLYRLSDLSEEDTAKFWRVWSAAEAERRRVIARHMADIVEDDYVVDFAPYFKQFLGDESEAVRVAALDGVWDATDVTLVSPILQLLQTDKSVEVRTAAAAALAHFVLMSEWGEISAHISPRIVAELIKVYEDGATAVAIKRATLEAMSPANNPRIVELIEAAYNDRLAEMRQSAVFAMGNNADTRWVPIILQELNNMDTEMQAEAARAAGLIGSSDAVEQLAALAQEEDEDLALVAITSLGQIGSEEAQEILTGMLDDEDFANLHEAIEEALEEMTWMNQELELFHIDEEDEEGN